MQKLQVPSSYGLGMVEKWHVTQDTRHVTCDTWQVCPTVVTDNLTVSTQPSYSVYPTLLQCLPNSLTVSTQSLTVSTQQPYSVYPIVPYRNQQSYSVYPAVLQCLPNSLTVSTLQSPRPREEGILRWHRTTNTQTDIATSRLNRPKGRFSEKDICIKEVFST